MLCCDTARDIRVAWLAYLACLLSHVLRAYCKFESKQANWITLFGRRTNNCLSSEAAKPRGHVFHLRWTSGVEILNRRLGSYVLWVLFCSTVINDLLDGVIAF